MLFHRAGISHVISELRALDFLVKEYPEKNLAKVPEFADKIHDYVEGKRKDGLNIIYQHSKNVLEHIKSDKDNQFRLFLEDISKLTSVADIGQLKVKVNDILKSQEQVQKLCVQLELSLREFITRLGVLYKEYKDGKPMLPGAIRSLDIYRGFALNAAKEIEVRSLESAAKIKIVQKGLAEMRAILRKIEPELSNTHWVYSNINSWLG